MLSKNQIREIQSLHLKKQRDLQKLFVAEGIKTVQDIISTSPFLLKSVFATTDFIKGNRSLLDLQKIVPVEVSEIELQKISMQSTPNQVLAVCKYFESKSGFEPVSSAFFLDDVRDPGNFGTILRLADWFGMKTVYCSPASCDQYNPKVIQSTMGAFLRVHVVYANIADLKPKFPVIYGAVLDGKNVYQEKLQPGLIVIGNEANGISEATMKLLTHRLTIPSASGSGMESLNAAMAASILSSEFFRQLG